MSKATEYGVSVRLNISEGEETYEARVAELPDVLAFGDTYAEAYEGAIEAITGLQEVFAEKGKAFPAPELGEIEFSGRVTLRMSKSLHATIHRRAALDGVSLNQWVIEAIAGRSERSTASPPIFISSQAKHAQSVNIGVRVLRDAIFGVTSSSGEELVSVSAGQEVISKLSLSPTYIKTTTNGQH